MFLVYGEWFTLSQVHHETFATGICLSGYRFHVALPQTAVKVDVGCGRWKAKDCIGIDILKAEGVDIQADACHLPFKDGSVDFVYSRECIQHIKKSDVLALKEIFRVLKKHSQATIIVSSFIAWLTWCVGISSWNYRYFRVYLDQNFKKKLRKAGFSSVSISHVTFSHKTIVSKKLLRHVKLSYHDIVGVCQKY